MNELALFAGVGGGILGGKLLGWNTVCAVEVEPYCREVLLRRQRDRVLPLFPIWDDVRTFDGKPWAEIVDVISAGFPCQPFSVAGRRAGDKDERNMWPDTIRVIREVRPRIALLENVPGLLAHPYIRTIFGDLAEAGYDAEWGVLGAADVGAPHRRKRLWIVAYANSWGRDGRRNGKAHRPIALRGQEMADTDITGASATGRTRHGRPESCDGGWWLAEPAVGRVAHGMAHRVDRLKAIGNGQVSGVVAEIWKQIMTAPRERLCKCGHVKGFHGILTGLCHKHLSGEKFICRAEKE